MTRAEELALKIFPKNSLEFLRTGRDFNGYRRQGFIKGYEQAKRDFALSWEDIAKIDALILEANNEFAVDYSKEISREQFYTEVLNRFNKSKEEK